MYMGNERGAKKEMKITRKGIYFRRGALLYRPLRRKGAPAFLDFNFETVWASYLEALEYEHVYAFEPLTGVAFKPTHWQRFLDKVLK